MLDRMKNATSFTPLAAFSYTNFNDLNTDGSFAAADSHLFLCPLEILLIIQENKC